MTDKNNNIDDKIVRGYGEQALRDEAQAILDQIPYLDDNFEKAVDMMYHCQGKIIVTGVGKSGHVGAKIAATLASTGTPAFYINPLDVYHGDLGVMTDKDVVLALSNSGQTDELLRFIPMVLHMNVPIISLGMIGISSVRITSSAVVSSRLPNSPPGWNCAKSRGLKWRTCIRAIASASPIANAAVVLLVGARFSGQASFFTFTVI